MWRLYVSFLLLTLTACAGGPERSASSVGTGLPPPTQCAVFVREISGIPLHGDAWTWWGQAAGRFARGKRPRLQSVLVLRATARLPLGHVALVRRIAGPREITVTHVDWGHDTAARRVVHDSMPVIDVSPANDWSLLRFWNARTHAYGRIYPAYGFIYPREPSADLHPVW